MQLIESGSPFGVTGYVDRIEGGGAEGVMQPTLKDLRQLLLHMGVGLAARHDPEPGPFLEKFQTGQTSRCRRHRYATTDGLIIPIQPSRPGETSRPGLKLGAASKSIGKTFGEAATAPLIALLVRGATLWHTGRMFDSKYCYHRKQAEKP